MKKLVKLSTWRGYYYHYYPPLKKMVPLLSALLFLAWAFPVMMSQHEQESALVANEVETKTTSELFWSSLEAEKIQRSRQNRLHNYCQLKLQKEGPNKRLVHSKLGNLIGQKVLSAGEKRPLSKRLTQQKDSVNLVTDKAGLIAYCHVPKVASTAWMTTLAKINGLMNTSAIEGLSAGGLLHAVMQNNYGTRPDDLSPDAFVFTFVRHPFERLVSAYHDKFVHRKEMSFIQPVIDWDAGLMARLAVTLLKHLPGSVEQDSEPSVPASDEPFQLNFEKFVTFVLNEFDTNTQTYGSLHWWPFTRLCGLCHVRYDFIGTLETLDSDAQYLANKSPELATALPILKAKKNADSGKTAVMSRHYFAQLPQSLVTKLYNAYQDDFQVAGYKFPQEYLDLAT